MRQYHNSHLSFIDMLFNALIVFAALFIFTVMLINTPTKKTKAVDETAKIMIVMTWNDDSADDMDLWLLTPEPQRIGYITPNGNIANLARDDLGKSNDFYVDKETGKTKYIHLNKEVITIRQEMPGHYEVDVMFYARKPDPENDGKKSVGPQEVAVQLIQISPVYKEIITRSVMLEHQHDVKTVFSFDIIGGDVVNIDTTTQDNFIMRGSVVPTFGEGG